MLLIRLNKLVKQENEIVREFHDKFETLLQNIHLSHQHSASFLLFIYTKAFIGHLGYLLRDTNPQRIQEVQELATRIEDNLSSSRIEPFSAPRVRMDTKPKIVHNVEPTKGTE
jgi:hypothetical protein